jgi:uncharacterized membrane protein YgcG
VNLFRRSCDQCADNLDPQEDAMNTRALDPRGLATLTAVLILVGTSTIAQARMGGIGVGAQQGTSMTTSTTTRHPYPPGYAAPPYAPNGPQRSSNAGGLSGGGGTGGFNPGGGSGTKPTKKPNVQ